MQMTLNTHGAPLETIEIAAEGDGDFDAASPHFNLSDKLSEPFVVSPTHFQPIWHRPCATSSSSGNDVARAPLQRRFEIIAQTNPAARAVACNGRLLTYGELDTEADELALQLQRDGLAPGSFCLLRLDPSLAFARVVLAVLKAGAACVQLDPALTREAIGAVLAILKPALLFLHERDSVGWGGHALRIVRCGEEAAPLPYGYPDEIAVGDDTPAHVFATVSSRGALCIKVRTHRALSARSDAAGVAGPLAAADPAAFWIPLSTGALLTIAPGA